MNVIKPPTKLADGIPVDLFLAGSIEQGLAVDWQKIVEYSVKNIDGTLLNPRREVWDSSWEQSIKNPVFREQVEWEIAGLDRADSVVFYFDPATKAPITLWELGSVCHLNYRDTNHKKVLVACPDGYWRKGNIEVVCDAFGITLLPSLDDLVENLLKEYTV